jgi:hypothetical protein
MRSSCALTNNHVHALSPAFRLLGLDGMGDNGHIGNIQA